MNLQRQRVEWFYMQRHAEFCTRHQQAQQMSPKDQRIALCILMSEAHRHHRRTLIRLQRDHSHNQRKHQEPLTSGNLLVSSPPSLPRMSNFRGISNHNHHFITHSGSKMGTRNGAHDVQHYTTDGAWKRIATAAMEDFEFGGHPSVQRTLSCMCIFSPVSSARVYSDHEEARLARAQRQRNLLMQIHLQAERTGKSLFLQ